MSKSNAEQRRTAQKKLPLALQRMLANGHHGAHTPGNVPIYSKEGREQQLAAPVTDEFYLNYLENRRQVVMKQKPFRDALHALHESNPFKEVAYGAALFTYVSTELSLKIGALCAEWKVAVQENLQGKSWSSVRYPWNEGKPVSSEYVLPSPDHADFMKFVTYEQLRATPEQDLNMRALLTQMAKDLGIADEAQNV
jgi:hypothetical protein